MKSTGHKKIKRTLITLVSLYLAGGIVLYLVQDLLLFHPKQLSPDYRYAFDLPHEEWNLKIEGRNLHMVRFMPSGPRKGIVLYFHGNMRNVERYASVVPSFTAEGYELWMPDYPGFGKSTGKRSEETLYADAVLLYREALKREPANRIIIYGRSIGTGIASYLAARDSCRWLMLETPYYSIKALVKQYFPVYPILPPPRYTFPTNQYLHQVTAPITIFHGTEDEVVPHRQALRLKEEHPRIELVSITGGTHNDLANFQTYRQELKKRLSE